MKLAALMVAVLLLTSCGRAQSVDDSFSTGTLNPALWTVDIGNCGSQGLGTTSTCAAANVDLSQGMLGLKLTQATAANSVGGEVRSIALYGYGTYEYTARMASTTITPNGQGAAVSGGVSGLFIYQQNNGLTAPNFSEVDFEVEGRLPNQLELTSWTSASPKVNEFTGATYLGMDQGFHRYKFIWEPGQIDYYVDSVLQATHKTQVPSAPAFIIFNLWGTNSNTFGGTASVGIIRRLYISHFTFTPLASRDCGPPSYSCTRTDNATVQNPVTPPSLGGLTGTNDVAFDPDFGTRIIRVTDANFDSPAHLADSFQVSCGGSGSDTLINQDSSLFLVNQPGGTAYPVSLVGSTFARLYSSGPGTGFSFQGCGYWSYTNPQILYVAPAKAPQGTPTVQQYNFTNRVTPPTATVVTDFRTPTCLGAGFSATWADAGNVSKDDQTFSAAFSNAGGQGTGVFAVAFRRGQGCVMLNTQTGAVTGAWGASGTVAITDRFSIHNTELSKDGNWLVITPTTCFSGAGTCIAGGSVYHWQIGTLNLIRGCNPGQACSGHFETGMTHIVNNSGGPEKISFDIRPFSNPAAFSPIIPNPPACPVAPWDGHWNWADADANDTYPFFGTEYDVPAVFPCAYYGEALLISPVSGKIFRVAHTNHNHSSQRFACANAIGALSQDGKWAMVSTDWGNSFGSETNGASCTPGTDCRCDVVALDLTWGIGRPSSLSGTTQ